VHNTPLLERFLSSLMGELLKSGGNCLCVRAKPAHIVGHLPAGKAYEPLQQIIHDEACDLSVYRFVRPGEKKWYVVVIGGRLQKGFASSIIIRGKTYAKQ
jgi:hypothetical protein